jgi:uncharacterized protein (TIGR02145 family)
MNKLLLKVTCFVLFVVLFFSCKEEESTIYTVGYYEFFIDSVYDITKTSVTIKATLYSMEHKENLVALQVYYVKESERGVNFTTKTKNFDQKEGTVTVTITDLEPNTVYYLSTGVDVRPNPPSFKTIVTGSSPYVKDVVIRTRGDLPDKGTVTDIDGNVYNYITLGNQTWMVENLRTTRLRNGTPIPHVTDMSKWKLSMENQALQTKLSYCDYNNDTVFGNRYGHIYDIVASRLVIAPEGWRLPTLSDWYILRNYLIANGYNFDKSTTENYVAKSLASSTIDWMGDYNGAGSIINNPALNNTTGFTALPGGYISREGEFKDQGRYCMFWSSTRYFQYNYYSSLESAYIGLSIDNSFQSSGMYIRCIREN